VSEWSTPRGGAGLGVVWGLVVEKFIGIFFIITLDVAFSTYIDAVGSARRWHDAFVLSAGAQVLRHIGGRIDGAALQNRTSGLTKTEMYNPRSGATANHKSRSRTRMLKKMFEFFSAGLHPILSSEVLLSPVKMFHCSKLPCLGRRSADFLQGFFRSSNILAF
jgi:hypothetical protein